MSPHLESWLKSRFFSVLADRDLDSIDVGDGWFEVVRDLCLGLERASGDLPPDLRFALAEIASRGGYLKIGVLPPPRLWEVPREVLARVRRLLRDAEAEATSRPENDGKLRVVVVAPAAAPASRPLAGRLGG